MFRVGKEESVVYAGHTKFEIYIKYPIFGGRGQLDIWLSGSGNTLMLTTEIREATACREYLMPWCQIRTWREIREEV